MSQLMKVVEEAVQGASARVHEMSLSSLVDGGSLSQIPCHDLLGMDSRTFAAKLATAIMTAILKVAAGDEDALVELATQDISDANAALVLGTVADLVWGDISMMEQGSKYAVAEFMGYVLEEIFAEMRKSGSMATDSGTGLSSVEPGKTGKVIFY